MLILLLLNLAYVHDVAIRNASQCVAQCAMHIEISESYDQTKTDLKTERNTKW